MLVNAVDTEATGRRSAVRDEKWSAPFPQLRIAALANPALRYWVGA
jgi:hypothetical protein